MRTRIAPALVAATFLVAACGTGSGVTSTGAAPLPTTTTAIPGAICPAAERTVSGRVDSQELTEISGVAFDPNGLLWVHNDSGDEPRVYALGAGGTLAATYELAGAAATDWEDIAIGPGPEAGREYLYVGDIGDNGESRPEVTVYRVPVPIPARPLSQEVVRLDGVESITLRYPDEPHNAEALLVDPRSGDLFIVTKDPLGRSTVYGIPAPVSINGTTSLEELATLRLGLGNLVTAGDVARDGSRIALRTYAEILVWPLPVGTSVADALQGEPCRVASLEPQGEALTLLPNGSLLTISEGARPDIHTHANS